VRVKSSAILPEGLGDYSTSTVLNDSSRFYLNKNT